MRSGASGKVAFPNPCGPMSETPPLMAQFGEFVLDEGNARLSRNGAPVEIAPKAFSVLCTLVRQPGQLVVKDALLDAVWGHQHVSESVLKTLVSQLRSALADDAKQPRYIETAARRGYRFIAPLKARPAAAPAPAEPTAPGAAGGLVGRTEPLAFLARALDAALRGRRQLVLVGGEPGIGKTSLIDRFIGAHGGEALAIATGQCVEHYGSGEPYMPVLEALNTLCRGAAGEVSLPLMRHVAPTWLAQLPWHLTAQDRQQLQREVAGATQDRMLREFGELLDRFTESRPLLLVLEDPHWSDPASVQLIGYLARRRTPARLVVLGSFRPAEVIASEHPLKGLRQELRLHGLCGELDLEAFSEKEVADYMAHRLPGFDCPEAYVKALHAHTEGLPLFIASVIDELMAQGQIRRGDAGWEVTAQRKLAVPDNVTGVIEKQIARLPEELRRRLGAASVAGVEFLLAPLAAMLEVDADELQEELDGLVRSQQWLRSAGVAHLSAGVTARYAFRHALHRHVFYGMAGKAQRIQLHARTGRALQQAYGAAAPDTAAELAMHFERGGEPAQAVDCLRLAAARALQRSAAGEAVSAARHALRLLDTLPASPERLGTELDLRVIEGSALTHIRAYSSRETAAAFERAQALCDMLPQSPDRARAFHGMWWVNFARGDLQRARALAQRMMDLGEAMHENSLLLAGHGAMGLTLSHAGDFSAALRHLRLGWETYQSAGDALLPGLFLQDPGVEILSYTAVVSWWVGERSRANAAMAQALALADAIRHPFSQCVALHFAGVLHTMDDRPDLAIQTTSRIQEIATEYGMWQGPGGHTWIRGWARALLGEVDAGLTQMREAETHCLKVGMRGGLTGYYYRYASACVAVGRPQEAAQAAQQGLALAQQAGEFCLASPLHRLHGQALAAMGDAAGAKAALQAALTLAQSQGARSFEQEARACGAV